MNHNSRTLNPKDAMDFNSLQNQIEAFYQVTIEDEKIIAQPLLLRLSRRWMGMICPEGFKLN